MLEELQMAWETKRNSPQYELYENALGDGRLQKLGNTIHTWMKSQHLFLHSVSSVLCYLIVLTYQPTVLHLYYKLVYIKVAWGGPKEQAEGMASGNLNAKDWQDEVRKLIEKTVSQPLPCGELQYLLVCVLDG